MTKREIFIRLLAQKLTASGVKCGAYQATRFVIENPEMENTWTIEDAATEWLSCASEAVNWNDPACYGTS